MILGFDVNPVIGAVGLAIVVFGAVGGMVGYFGQQRAKTVIELQAAEIDTQKKRIDTLVEENGRQREEITELKTSLRVLRETVTQSAKVEMLASASESQHRAIVLSLDRLTQSMADLAASVRDREAQ